MTAVVEQMFNTALSLPEDQLRELTDALNDRMDEESADSFEISPEWKEEIRRRSELIDQGKTTSAPWPEVRARVWQKVTEMCDAQQS